MRSPPSTDIGLWINNWFKYSVIRQDSVPVLFIPHPGEKKRLKCAGWVVKPEQFGSEKERWTLRSWTLNFTTSEQWIITAVGFKFVTKAFKSLKKKPAYSFKNTITKIYTFLSFQVVNNGFHLRDIIWSLCHLSFSPWWSLLMISTYHCQVPMAIDPIRRYLEFMPTAYLFPSAQ